MRYNFLQTSIWVGLAIHLDDEFNVYSLIAQAKTALSKKELDKMVVSSFYEMSYWKKAGQSALRLPIFSNQIRGTERDFATH